MEEILLMLQSDKGSEFNNAQLQSSLKEFGILLYTSEYNDIKAAIVERFNCTLKTRMYIYFSHWKSFRHADTFQDLVYSYNRSHHKSILMEPAIVTANNE